VWYIVLFMLMCAHPCCYPASPLWAVRPALKQRADTPRPRLIGTLVVRSSQNSRSWESSIVVQSAIDERAIPCPPRPA
jgi:hypothetical protein